MKKTRLVLGALLGAAFVVSICLSTAEQETKKPSRRQTTFMRQKLAYNQFVLEGLALEKFDLIITYGQKMWNMGQDNLWQQLFTEEYKTHSQNYRSNVLAMVDAARDKKLDAAMTAYRKSLQNCYDCHKYFRVEERAKAPRKKSFE